MDKVDDLENHSRWNNLRIIGIPERYNANNLNRLCSVATSEALGLHTLCVVERAHRIGAFQPDRKGRDPLLLNI